MIFAENIQSGGLLDQTGARNKLISANLARRLATIEQSP